MNKTPLLATALALSIFTGSHVQAEAQDIAITLADGVITPATVEIPADTALTLVVSNTGKTPAEFESKKLHLEQVIAPGAKATIALQPLPAGSYAFVDEFHETLDTARGTIVSK